MRTRDLLSSFTGIPVRIQMVIAAHNAKGTVKFQGKSMHVLYRIKICLPLLVLVGPPRGVDGRDL